MAETRDQPFSAPRGPSQTISIQQGSLFILDGSNLILPHGASGVSPDIRRLMIVRDQVTSDFRPRAVKIFVDSTLPGRLMRVGQSREYERLLRDRTVNQVPSRAEADEHILRLAIRLRERGDSAVVVSNDAYRGDYQELADEAVHLGVVFLEAIVHDDISIATFSLARRGAGPIATGMSPRPPRVALPTPPPTAPPPPQDEVPAGQSPRSQAIVSMVQVAAAHLRKISRPVPCSKLWNLALASVAPKFPGLTFSDKDAGQGWIRLLERLETKGIFVSRDSEGIPFARWTGRGQPTPPSGTNDSRTPDDKAEVREVVPATIPETSVVAPGPSHVARFEECLIRILAEAGGAVRSDSLATVTLARYREFVPGVTLKQIIGSQKWNRYLETLSTRGVNAVLGKNPGVLDVSLVSLPPAESDPTNHKKTNANAGPDRSSKPHPDSSMAKALRKATVDLENWLVSRGGSALQRDIVREFGQYTLKRYGVRVSSNVFARQVIEAGVASGRVRQDSDLTVHLVGQRTD